MKSKQDCLTLCHRLGLMENDVVLLHHHPILNNLLNGPATMVEAVLETIGHDGTLIIYDIMNLNQDPSHDRDISFDRRERMRQELVEFDMKKYRETVFSPTLLALTKVNGFQMNQHPKVVVGAVGKYASLITKGQPLDFPFGEQSPFETLKDLNAKIVHFSDDYSDMHELRYGYNLANIQSIATHGVAMNNEWTKFNDYRNDSSKYHAAIDACDKKVVNVKEKKIQSFLYQEALNQFVNQHSKLFNELGQ